MVDPYPKEILNWLVMCKTIKKCTYCEGPFPSPTPSPLHPEIGRLVNPIQTREGRLNPSHCCKPPTPSYLHL